MIPFYERFEENLEIYDKKSSHIPPHLHKSLECIYVTEGTLELGVGQELYHMEKHDFGIVFPEMIHHYQVFDTGECRALYLLASVALFGGYGQTLQQLCPKVPVIKAECVHKDIPYAMGSLLEVSDKISQSHTLWQAFMQIILARAIPQFQLLEKDSMGSDDIVYRTVTYIAGHFTEELTLTQVAEALGYSQYVLSRVFSGTFHMNFNSYLNQVRLEYACGILKYTNQTITEAYENSGFGSQRTFNRVFFERYRMSPRDYRKMIKAHGLDDDFFQNSFRKP